MSQDIERLVDEFGSAIRKEADTRSMDRSFDAAYSHDEKQDASHRLLAARSALLAEFRRMGLCRAVCEWIVQESDAGVPEYDKGRAWRDAAKKARAALAAGEPP